jgi:hypothetical protein
MDLTTTLEQLKAQVAKIEGTIAMLEDIQRTSSPHGTEGSSRRGRREMGLAEREEVSARMKRYWDQRRQQKNQLGGQAE